jgi:hypothetical protein
MAKFYIFEIDLNEVDPIRKPSILLTSPENSLISKCDNICVYR